MDDEDRSNLRDLHAGFALIGLLISGQGGFNPTVKAYELADDMQEARNQHGAGIVSVKRRTKKEKADD
jgi:predicted transcriptional regulator